MRYKWMESKMKRRQAGFSLVELMIVVAIIGILAAVAVPAYTNYTTRSKVASALALASGMKTAITDFQNANGNFPANNGDINFGAANTINNAYVASVGVGAGGVITITFGAAGGAIPAALGARTITLTPAAAAGTGIITWACASAAIPVNLSPQGCAFAGAAI